MLVQVELHPVLIRDLQLGLIEVRDDLLVSIFDNRGFVDLDRLLLVRSMLAHLPHAHDVLIVARNSVHALAELAVHRLEVEVLRFRRDAVRSTLSEDLLLLGVTCVQLRDLQVLGRANLELS